MLYNLSYDNKIKIGGKELKFRPWTTKEEKNYLLTVDPEKGISDSEIFEILIKPCLENKTIILDSAEMKYILIEIRKVSIGNTYNIRYICGNEDCKSVNLKEVDFEQSVFFTDSTFKEVTVKDVSITFGRLKSQSALNKISLAVTEVERLFLEMVYSIEKIKFQNEEFESFTAEEVSEFLDSLPTIIMDEFVTEFVKMKPSIEIKSSQKCFKCGEVKDIYLEQIPNFLWE